MMTRERMALYLITMAWLESEPVTKLEFEVKINTEKRINYVNSLTCEIMKRFGKGSCNGGYRYYSKNPRINWITRKNWEPELDMEKFTVYAGSWSDKEHIDWLVKELNKKKIEYSKIERR